MKNLSIISLVLISLVACTQSDTIQKLFTYELTEREKNLEYCVIKKIHRDDNHLISYDKTGHKKISEDYHVTYFQVKFHVHPGIEVEKEDSITFCRNDQGHWLCDDCDQGNVSNIPSAPARD